MWPKLPLENLADIYGGSTPRRNRDEFWGGEIPWLTPTDLPKAGEGIVEIIDTAERITQEGLKSCAARIMPVGSVLFSSRASIGKIGIAKTPLATNQGFINLVPKDGIDSRYLAYCLQYHTNEISALAGSTTFKEISRGSAKKFRVPVPPLSEQRRIVEILDQADALRKQRTEADAKATRILPALFYQMFGDPATNPKGWPHDQLSNLFDIVGGGTPSKSNKTFWQGIIPWVSPKDMKCEVITDTTDHITEEAIRNSATRLVNKGSILIVYRSGILAHTFPVAIAGCDVTLNQDMKALNSKGELLNEYLYGWLVSASNIMLGCVKKGATVHNIDGSRFRSLQIGKPPITLQKQFADQLYSLFSDKNRRLDASKRIEILFDVLLHRAFSGALTAKWREAHMKELLQEMEHQAKSLGITYKAAAGTR